MRIIAIFEPRRERIKRKASFLSLNTRIQVLPAGVIFLREFGFSVKKSIKL